MATFHIPITCPDTTGSVGFKVKYRHLGDSMWNAYMIPVPPTSGTTAVIGPLDNYRIYEFQIQNINNNDNPLTPVTQDLGWYLGPQPVTISPTSSAVGYSFNNLSVDVDNYNVQLTTVADPGTILGTHIIPAGVFPNVLTDTFTGLIALTAYRLVITPVANQFSQPFVYTFTTSAAGECPNVPSVTASLT
jgi:hypothetical protein